MVSPAWVAPSLFSPIWLASSATGGTKRAQREALTMAAGPLLRIVALQGGTTALRDKNRGQSGRSGPVCFLPPLGCAGAVRG